MGWTAVRFSSIVQALLFLSIFFIILFKSFFVADFSWDVIAYHLPFAAYKAGILSFEQFSINPHLLAAVQSFPDVIYHFKGWLWIATGRPEAVNLVNPISLLFFCIFCNNVLNVRYFWALAIVLAIPIMHVAISGGMTDLCANLYLTIVVLCCYKALNDSDYINTRMLAWLFVAAFFAAGSKPQAVPLVGLFLASYISCYFFSIKNGFNSVNFTFVFSFVLLALITLYKPVLNLFQFGNPIYPMAIKVLGHQFPGVFSLGGWNDPQYLANAPQPVRWLLSVLEFDAFSMRPTPYTVDQGEVPLVAHSFRMGGYNVSLVLFNLGILLFNLFFYKTRETKLALYTILALSLLVSVLPGSQELRYYSFWMLSLLLINFYVLASLKDHDSKKLIYTFQLMIVVSVVYFVTITGARYSKFTSVPYDSFNISGLSNVLENDKAVCFYGDDARFAILFALSQQKIEGQKKRVLQRSSKDECI